MGKFDGVLIVSDIDGTLYWHGAIPKRNIDAIRHFKSEGGIFSIATGRCVEGSVFIHNEAESNAPLVACHGGQIFDIKNNALVYDAKLDDRIKSVLPVIMGKFPNIGVEIFEGLNLYEYRSNFGTRWHKEYEKLTFTKLPEDINSVSWSKVLMAIDTAEEVLEIEAFCNSLGLDYCRFLKTSNHENARYLEILPLGVNKGTALKELKKITGAKIAYGIGDYYNDVELIKDADFGAVVAEAPDDIKALADFVTGPCKEGAVADLIEKIV